MTLPTTSLKNAAAGFTALAVTFTLAACGSEGETTGGGLSTAATAPGAATVAEGTTAPEAEASGSAAPGTSAAATATTKPKASAAPGDRDNQQGGQPDVAVPTLINPLEQGLEAPTFEPIEGGREGTEAERKEMEEVLRKVSNPDSFASWTRVILDNSCAAVREPALEEMERQGVTLEMVEQLLAQQEAMGDSITLPETKVSLTDVRVDGNRASGTASTSNASGNASAVQLFEKEDGRWKVCTG